MANGILGDSLKMTKSGINELGNIGKIHSSNRKATSRLTSRTKMTSRKGSCGGTPRVG